MVVQFLPTKGEEVVAVQALVSQAVDRTPMATITKTTIVGSKVLLIRTVPTTAEAIIEVQIRTLLETCHPLIKAIGRLMTIPTPVALP